MSEVTTARGRSGRARSKRSASRLGRALGAVGALVAGAVVVAARHDGVLAAPVAPAGPATVAAIAAGTVERDGAPAVSAAAGAALPFRQDTLAGRSGKLRARWLDPARVATFPFLRRLLGDTATRPGVYAVEDQAVGRPFTFITLLPFSAKSNGRIGTYRIGAWPNELGARLNGKYANPAGFIRVTRDNAATPVSEHFRLRDFLTKDQVNVWPKYLVLDPDLIDKLELVLDDLRARGYDAKRLHVMSGFRTPQYNKGGGDPRGRADLSRHQYGDAADVWVENGAGRMADLNRDGRVDMKDAAILAESVDRVERRHPDLVGGVGLYRANSAHGPFVHIDTRGKRARWGGSHG